MIELLQYTNVKNSRFGYQWTVIGEYADEATANAVIGEYIEQGHKREDFKTREKINREERYYGGFQFKSKPVHFDMKASERRDRWNSDDPRVKV